LAKFPKPVGDEWNVMAWEGAMLDAMSAVGIETPWHETRRIRVDGSERTVLFVKRFDRRNDRVRVPYISAMTALEATDGEGGDWLDVVDFAQVAGSDTTQFWRRAVFGALVGNLDDHLRNHGFLRRGADWRPSPAFDVNPEPLGDGNEHQLALFGNRDLVLDSFMTKDALNLFRVKQSEVGAFLDRLRPVIIRLPRFAEARGADAASVEMMAGRIDAASAAVK
jgi:serine/threonine-protein kinase HipA